MSPEHEDTYRILGKVRAVRRPLLLVSPTCFCPAKGPNLAPGRGCSGTRPQTPIPSSQGLEFPRNPFLLMVYIILKGLALGSPMAAEEERRTLRPKLFTLGVFGCWLQHHRLPMLVKTGRCDWPWEMRLQSLGILRDCKCSPGAEADRMLL